MQPLLFFVLNAERQRRDVILMKRNIQRKSPHIPCDHGVGAQLITIHCDHMGLEQVHKLAYDLQ